MSTVSNQELTQIARLARLALTQEEEASLCRDLSEILTSMELLAQVETTHVEPMTHGFYKPRSLRPDTPSPSLPPSVALASAKQTEDNCFVVPPVLTGEE